MIFLDLGGTKVKILFPSKEKFFSFVKSFRKELLVEDEKKKLIIFPSFYIKKEKSFFNFLNLLGNLDSIVLAFPEPIYENKIYSKKYSFLDKKTVNYLKKYNVVFVTNDLKAFAYNHAKKFFSKKNNENKVILSIQIGTGVNAIPLNKKDFEDLSYLERIYESGHSVFIYNSEKCKCGRKGCAELFISGEYLNKVTNNKPEALKYLESLKDNYYKKLAYFISSLMLITGAEKVVVGGGVSKSLDEKRLKQEIEKILPFGINLKFDLEIDNSDLSVLNGLKELWKKVKK